MKGKKVCVHLPNSTTCSSASVAPLFESSTVHLCAYRFASEQPLHPGRKFIGRKPVREHYTTLYSLYEKVDLKAESIATNMEPNGSVGVWLEVRSQHVLFRMSSCALHRVLDSHLCR